MVRKKATKHTSAFKPQVALAALVGDRTANQLAAQRGKARTASGRRYQA